MKVKQLLKLKKLLNREVKRLKGHEEVLKDLKKCEA